MRDSLITSFHQKNMVVNTSSRPGATFQAPSASSVGFIPAPKISGCMKVTPPNASRTPAPAPISGQMLGSTR